MTLQGQMLAGAAPATQHPVSLALAWYPAWLGASPGASARAVFTQEATFTGNFPVSFSFEIYGPPPPEALVDLAQEGGQGVSAYGVLLAFEDRNGNGKLDLGTATQPSPDRVMGTSVGDPSHAPALSSYFIVYMDGQSGPGGEFDGFALSQGFNLLMAHGRFGVEVLPLDTSITIQLTGTNAVNYYACSHAFSSPETPWAPACGIDQFDGRYRSDNLVMMRGPIPRAWPFEVMNASGPVADATIELNGTVLTYDPVAQGALGTPVFGTNDLKVSVPGFSTEQLTFIGLQQMTLTQPLPAEAPAGSTLTLSWNPVPGAVLYDLYMLDPDSNRWIDHQLTTGTTFVTKPLVSASGVVQVTLWAIAPLAVSSGGSVSVTSVSRITGFVSLTE